jgi:putative transposase
MEGAIKTVTVQPEHTGKGSAGFWCKVEPKHLPVTDKMVGIDLGLKTFACMRDGSKIERQRWMKKDAKASAGLQRKPERFAIGAPERHPVVCAWQPADQRATNRRSNLAHQESCKRVNAGQLLVFEDLDLQNRQSDGKRVINQNLADLAWGRFVQDTRSQAAKAGSVGLLVNPRGTTQEGSGCGPVVPKDLSVRVHDGPRCGLKIDRDLNAALNILGRGLASIGADWSVTRRSPRVYARE